VMMKARRVTGGGPVNFPRTLDTANEAGQSDAGKGKKRQ
jgi:hypothetical protein